MPVCLFRRLWQKCVRLSRTMARESDLATRAAMHESIHHVTKRVLRSMPQHQHVHCTCRTIHCLSKPQKMENVKTLYYFKNDMPFYQSFSRPATHVSNATVPFGATRTPCAAVESSAMCTARWACIHLGSVN